MEIEGHNLGPLVAEIREGKLNLIREMPTARQLLLGDGNLSGEPVIVAVRSYPDVEKMMNEIKKEDEHGQGGHDRRVRRQ